MAALLGVAAAGSGTLAGFVSGVAWAATGAGRPGPAIVGALLLATAAAEASWLTLGRPAPPSVRRQVPRAWAQLFAPETVALLYGARLGVGPLTVVGTWLWWGALLAGAAGGVGTAALAGGAFGGARVVLMVAVAEWARRDMAGRMGHLRRREALVGGVATAALLSIVPFLG